MTATPAIITVAITGSLPRKKDNPAVPVTPAEQIEATHQAYEAGAALVHIHVRNADESASSDPTLFAQVFEGVRRHCPGMIVQFSTGGRGREQSQRAAALDQRPDMASLATGTVNFANSVYENHPQLISNLAETMLQHGIKPEIEVFDAAMLYNACAMAKQGLLKRPLHVQFVLGIQNALPVRREVLEFLVRELHTLEPGATWCAMGIGRDQLTVNRWCMEMGGHLRTGFEDNVRYDATRLARDNAELVERLVALCPEYGRRAATVQEARQLLGLAVA